MVSIASTSAAAAPTEAPLVHVAFNSGASHFVACTARWLHVFSCDDTAQRVHNGYNATVAAAR